MTKDTIKRYAASFIHDASVDSWSQEAHNAFVVKVLRAELGLDSTQAIAILEIQAAMPSLMANASAFRQWLESKDVALLAKATESKPLGNRYGAMVTKD